MQEAMWCMRMTERQELREGEGDKGGGCEKVENARSLNLKKKLNPNSKTKSQLWRSSNSDCSQTDSLLRFLGCSMLWFHLALDQEFADKRGKEKKKEKEHNERI